MDEATEQKLGISDCQSPDLFRRNKTLFLISAEWWKKWTMYVGYDAEPSGVRPGPIDNSTLILGTYETNNWATAQLRPSLHEHVDFEYLAPTAWRRLVAWYGGSLPIEIFLVDGIPDLNPVPISVKVIETSAQYLDPGPCLLLSVRVPIPQLHKYLCEHFAVPFYKYSLRLEDRVLTHNDGNLEDCTAGLGSRLFVTMKEMPVIEVRTSPAVAIGEIQGCYPQITIPERTTPSSHGDTQDESDVEIDVLQPRNFFRADRGEVELRVTAANSRPKVRLGIRDISKSEKAVSSLWLDFQHKDLI